MTSRRPSILILTQFFPPETGAAQNRLAGLAKEFSRRGASVTVLTAKPNYPTGCVFDGYRGRWFMKERIGDYDVLRTWSWVAKGRGIFNRGLSFLSFGVSSLLLGLIRVRQIDIIIWESPPLPLGLSAWVLAKLLRARLVTNVSDLWTESLLALGMIKPGVLSRMFAKFERFVYRASRMVSGQTAYIVKRVREDCPGANLYLWRNGTEFLAVTQGRTQGEADVIGVRNTQSGFVIGFAGLIGYAQGLSFILDAAEALRKEPVKFVLVGDGPERESLMRQTEDRGLANIIWHPPVPHATMPEVWRSFDCALVCLRRGGVFRGAVPSKLYEAMGAGLPILLAIEGEAEEIVRDADCGRIVVPCDAQSLVQAARSLLHDPQERHRLGENARRVAISKYSRPELTRAYADAVLQLIESD